MQIMVNIVKTLVTKSSIAWDVETLTLKTELIKIDNFMF